MRAKLLAGAAWVLVLVTAFSSQAAYGRSLLDELGFSEPPGSRMLTAVDLARNRVAELERQYASQLGLRSMDRIVLEEYSLSPSRDAQEILGLYEPALEKQNWGTVARTVNRGVGVAIMSNERQGVLIMLVDPAGQQSMTLLRIAGQLDPSGKIDHGRLSKFVGEVSDNSQIPVGGPISVPPSEKFHLKATRSDIRGRLVGQSTAEIRLFTRGMPGEMTRIDDRLVLELAPKLAVDQIDFPANHALLVELTEGSLFLTGNPYDRPVRLNVVSTGAPVTLNGVPLVSGTHSIKSVNGEVRASLSPVEGGAFGIEVTGGDVTLMVPRNASATVKAAATSGKVQNLTDVTPDQSSDSSMVLKMGAGKADISLRAVNGTVCIKYGN